MAIDATSVYRTTTQAAEVVMKVTPRTG